MDSADNRPGLGAQAGVLAVMCGAMALSYAGMAAAVQPAAGQLKALYPIVVDGAALMGLHQVMTAPRRSPVRPWAWTLLVLAGSTSVGLNTWHALASGRLPLSVGVAYGCVPVLLAYLSSHMAALSGRRAAPAPVEPPRERHGEASAALADSTDSSPVRPMSPPDGDPERVAAWLAEQGMSVTRTTIRDHGGKGGNDRLAAIARTYADATAA